MSVVLFLIVLAALIFVHELGHFLVARWCGIRVDAFALGFGPKIFSVKRGETEYSLNLIPFGGYVKIFGENPDDDSIHGPDSARSFVHKSKWQQLAVLCAGVFFNFAFAAVLFVGAFSLGVSASTESYGQYSERFADSRVMVVSVNPGSPAERAGLVVGDTLVASSTAAVQEMVKQSSGRLFALEFVRNGVASTTQLRAEQGIIKDTYAIGLAMDDVATLTLPLHLSILESARLTVHMIGATFAGLFELIANAFRGTASLESVTGPVGIAGLIGDAARLGLTSLLMFTAVISINLGVLNLMPFPALDGGRVIFVIVEAIIRRNIRPVVANSINLAGFALLMLLMIVVTYRDIMKLFS